MGNPTSRHSLRKQGIQKDINQEWTPALRLFLKRGDEGEWARVTKVWLVTKVQGMHPSPSVILCESRESRKTLAKNGPQLCSEGDERCGVSVAQLKLAFL